MVQRELPELNGAQPDFAPDADFDDQVQAKINTNSGHPFQGSDW
jgi:hypothetical protein